MTQHAKRNIVAVTSSLAGALLLFSGTINLGWALDRGDPLLISVAAFVVIYGMLLYTVWMNGIRFSPAGFNKEEYRRVFLLLLKYRKKIEWTFREDIAGFEGVYKTWNFRVLLPGDWNDWGWQFEARRTGYEGVARYWTRNGNLDEDLAQLIDELFIHSQMARGSWNVQHNDPIFSDLKKSLKAA
jgi:hypothetical protein